MGAMTVPSPAAGGDGRQFVTFSLQGELYGVPLAEVQEIIRMPELVQVPLAPPSLEGIANLRGAVLPVTSLRRVFAVQAAAHDDATRVVVINLGTPVGFVVDRMANVIAAEPEQIESGDSLPGTMRGELVCGVVKRREGMILLLDPARLAAVEAPPASLAAGLATGLRAERVGGAPPPQSGRGEAASDEVQLVSFAICGEEYAFAIEEVQEIVQMPERLSQVPRAAGHVVGVMTLRDRLLPLVSLRRMFGQPGRALDEQSRIVVVSTGRGEAVGVVMDTVNEVLRVSRALIDPVPPLIAAAGAEMTAICRLAGGQRLVTILSAERMFDRAALRQALETAGHEEREEEAMGAHAEGGEAPGGLPRDDAEEQFVVFRLDGEDYGVPIDAVQEIVRVPEELTVLPRAPDFIEGVVNLRGTVLPVVDQRRRFGLPDAERNDRQRIMVLTLGGVRTGFVVDGVSEVLKIEAGRIEPAPRLSPEQARLIRRVANLQERGRMILLLSPENLVDAAEVEALRDTR